jgi:hypothetical protein
VGVLMSRRGPLSHGNVANVLWATCPMRSGPLAVFLLKTHLPNRLTAELASGRKEVT